MVNALKIIAILIAAIVEIIKTTQDSNTSNEPKN